MDQCKKSIHTSAVTRRSGLVHHRMHRYRRRDSRKGEPSGAVIQGLNNCQNAMLTAIRVPSLTYDCENLAGKEAVETGIAGA